MDSFLELEKTREKFANLNNLKKFRKTYGNKSFSPKDLNTPSFWNLKTKNNQEGLIVSPIYKHKLKTILSFLKKARGRLLDVGFGYGHIEQQLQGNLMIDIFGIDFSPFAVSRAQRSLRGNYQTGNILNLPQKASHFDFVLCLDVLEHVYPTKTFKAYKELKRVLKKDGILIISVPLNENLEKMIEQHQNPNGHMRKYTPSILKTELKIAGFNVFRERKLYAFNRLYFLKSFLINFLPVKLRQPNLLILFARKK